MVIDALLQIAVVMRCTEKKGQTSLDESGEHSQHGFSFLQQEVELRF